MPDSDFKKIASSDETFPGARQIILCGFKEKEQELFRKILKKSHVAVDLLYATEAEEDLTLEELNALPADSGRGEPSNLARAIIVAGITQKEFKRLLERTGKSTLKRPLWATFTETSQKWELAHLLNELNKERAVMG